MLVHSDPSPVTGGGVQGSAGINFTPGTTFGYTVAGLDGNVGGTGATVHGVTIRVTAALTDSYSLMFNQGTDTLELYKTAVSDLQLMRVNSTVTHGAFYMDLSSVTDGAGNAQLKGKLLIPETARF